MNFKKMGKVIAGALPILGVIFATAFLLSRRSEDDSVEYDTNDFDVPYPDDWLSSASDNELSDAYEDERQRWLANGCPSCRNSNRSYEMERINTEISKRSAEKWMNDPRRNPDPNFHWTDANRWDRD